MFGNKDDQQNDQDQAQFQAQPPVTPSAPEPTPNATLDSTVPDGTAAPAFPSAPPELPGKSNKVVAPLTPPPLTSATPIVSEDLLKLKQDALQQLSPLISHLDQTPEERFRTTMMMIQATDDSAKIKDAYEAAQAIGDEKARAQALLDIVNEINYFTQQHQEK